MHARLRTTVMVLIAGALTAFLAACGGGDGDKTPSAVAQPTSAAATSTTPEAGGGTNASIKIVSPADNWSASGDRVEVQVQVAGLKLDGTKIGQPAAQNPGVGHWHVYVDGKYAGLSVSDVVSLPNDAMPTIAAGAHEIKVQLHNTDHTPVVPEATDAVNVTFPNALTYTADATGTPSIKIVSPADGASINGRVVVQVAVAGITLDGTKIGLPADQNPGVGHWHVYVDGKYAGLSVSDVIALPNDAMPSITPGPHEIKVQLHHTDHTPLTPEVTDTINLTFK